MPEKGILTSSGIKVYVFKQFVRLFFCGIRRNTFRQCEMQPYIGADSGNERAYDNTELGMVEQCLLGGY